MRNVVMVNAVTTDMTKRGTSRLARAKRRRRLARSTLQLAAAAGAAAWAGTARGQNVVYTYTGPGGTPTAPVTGDFNTAGNFNGNSAAPVSSATTELDFGGSGATAYTATNNISTGTFDLNEIQFNSTATVTETIAAATSANTLTFVANNGTLPQILQNNAGAFNISAGLVLGDNLTVGGTGTGALTFSGVISDTNANVLTIGTGGRVALSGTNTYSGGTVINSGTVVGASQLGGVNNAYMNGNAPGFGTGAITVNQGAVLTGSAAFTVAGGSATTRLVALNGGTWDMTYASTGGEYVAALNLSAGTVSTTATGGYFRVPSNSNVGLVVNSLAAGTRSVISTGIDETYGSATFNVAQGSVANGQDLVVSGAITQNTGVTGQGPKTITKLGAGTLVLSGSNRYTGGTIINAGTLALGAGGSLGAGAITVASGATFRPTTGTLAGTAGANGATLSLPSGSTFDLASGSATTGAFNLNAVSATTTSLTLGGATLDFGLGNTGVTTLATTGLASLGGITNTINISPLPTATNVIDSTYSLITAAGGLSGGGFQFANGTTSTTFAAGGFTYMLNLQNSATAEQLVVSGGNTSFYYTGNLSNVLTAKSGGTTNFATDATGATDTGAIPTSTSNVFFIASGAKNLNTVLGADLSINSLTFNDTADASHNVTIGGANTLTVGGGGITITSGSGSHTISTAALVLGTSQTWTNNGANPFTVSAPIAGPGSALTLAGTGTFVLSGNNTFSGNTSAGAGTLLLANRLALQNSTLVTGAGPVTFDAGATTHAFTLGGLSGSAAIALADNAGNPVALTVGGNNATTTYSGVLSGAGSLTKAGTGALTLSGSSTYAGGTVVNGGTAVGGSDPAFNGGNAPGFGTGPITVNNAVLTGATGTNRTVGGGNATTRLVTLNNATWDMTYAGTGGEYVAALNLSGGTVSNTSSTAAVYFRVPTTGDLTVNSLAATTSSVISTGIDESYANLAFNVARGSVASRQDLVVSGAITQDKGTGSTTPRTITKLGTGTLVLSGSSSYTGGTTISGGTLRAENATASLGTGAVTVAGGVLAGSGTTGTGAVTLNATGTVTGGTGATTADTIGTLTVGSGGLTLNGGTYAVKLDLADATSAMAKSGASVNATPGGPAVNDELVIGGLLTATSGLTPALTISPVTLSSTAVSGTTYSFVIADSQNANTGGTGNGASAFDNLMSQITVPTTDAQGNQYALSTKTDGGSGEDLLLDVTAVAAPEPTSLLLAGLAAAPLALGRRRRRRLLLAPRA